MFRKNFDDKLFKHDFMLTGIDTVEMFIEPKDSLQTLYNVLIALYQRMPLLK